MDGVAFPSNRSVSRLNRGPIGLAVTVSVLLHLAWLLGASHLGVDASPSSRSLIASRGIGSDTAPMRIDWSPPPPEPEAPPPQPPAPTSEVQHPEPERPPLRLGITESDQQADNAMGFNDPTPHTAPQSEVDQPALDPRAIPAIPMGTPTAAAPPAEPPPPAAPLPAEPAVSRPAEPAPTPAQTASPRGNADTSHPEQIERPRGDDATVHETPGDQPPEGSPSPEPARPASTMGKDVPAPADGEDTETIDKVLPRDTPDAMADLLASLIGPMPPSELPPAPRPVPPTDPSSTPPTPAPLGTTAPQPPGPVGIRSEKEADPASRTRPIEVILGRPAAAQGLEIITKRPRRNPFSLVTRATAIPESPVLEVTFNRSGAVSRATVVKSSGSPDVDSPVLAAVYGWTARGKELELLPSNDPEAGITIRVTILLR